MSLTGKPPIGLKEPKPERGTKAAKAHMNRVKQLPCVICNRHGPSDAHHIFCGRYGSTKKSDFDVIPLCKKCHQVGPNSIHRNKRKWIERNGPDHAYLKAVKISLE